MNTLISSGGLPFPSRETVNAPLLIKPAVALDLPSEFVLTAYEDVPKLLKDEAALPLNADPLQADLSDPQQRSRLARLLLAGLDRPAGFVLPLRAAPDTHESSEGVIWETSPWPLRRERLYAVAGDSPLGLRLPLGSLPDVMPEETEVDPPVDPFAPRAALAARASRKFSPGPPRPKTKKLIKTALTVQVREGNLYIFMPPLKHAREYIALLEAIEYVAGAMHIPVAIEGYAPPRDPGLRVLGVTPDPGVIEVNVHPASSWRELMDTTSVLYEEARQARLGTEKFMLDGRHTGTGGGNHVTLCGAVPADSPLLRRPDLLQSLVTYWQNHPALSYLFSGTFIGPTSQAPRVDEARDDRLYELEIAFQQLSRKHRFKKDESLPWLALLSSTLSLEASFSPT